jgi:hypothetical protein
MDVVKAIDLRDVLDDSADGLPPFTALPLPCSLATWNSKGYTRLVGDKVPTVGWCFSGELSIPEGFLADGTYDITNIIGTTDPILPNQDFDGGTNLGKCLEVQSSSVVSYAEADAIGPDPGIDPYTLVMVGKRSLDVDSGVAGIFTNRSSLSGITVFERTGGGFNVMGAQIEDSAGAVQTVSVDLTGSDFGPGDEYLFVITFDGFGNVDFWVTDFISTQVIHKRVFSDPTRNYNPQLKMRIGSVTIGNSNIGHQMFSRFDVLGAKWDIDDIDEFRGVTSLTGFSTVQALSGGVGTPASYNTAGQTIVIDRIDLKQNTDIGLDIATGIFTLEPGEYHASFGLGVSSFGGGVQANEFELYDVTNSVIVAGSTTRSWPSGGVSGTVGGCSSLSISLNPSITTEYKLRLVNSTSITVSEESTYFSIFKVGECDDYLVAGISTDPTGLTAPDPIPWDTIDDSNGTTITLDTVTNIGRFTIETGIYAMFATVQNKDAGIDKTIEFIRGIGGTESNVGTDVLLRTPIGSNNGGAQEMVRIFEVIGVNEDFEIRVVTPTASSFRFDVCNVSIIRIGS